MKHNLNSPEVLDQEKKDKQFLKLLNPVTCRLAIKWLKEKIKEHGGQIKDEEGFDCDLRYYIERSWVTIGGKALLSSAETMFFKEPKNDKSLKEIFDDHGISIGSYIFSITITPREVFVVDGKANGRRKVEYNEQKGKFEYSTVLIQASTQL